MKSLKQIVEEAKNTVEIKGLVGVYEEIAATKMQKIRDSVVNAQEYFEGLANLAEDVALDLSGSYTTKKKDAAVFLSAETGLYGDLIDRVLVSFVDFVKKEKVDVFVVGKLGVNLMRTYAIGINFSLIEMDGDNDDIGVSGLNNVMKVLNSYSKIYIFHGRFKSIARQESIKKVISGPELEKYGGDLDKDEIKKKRFINIYEPDAAQVGAKFGKEISVSILDQSIRENQLAKYAARLMHLDSTLDNIDNTLMRLDNDKKRMRKKIEQKKQTERTARWQRV